MKVNNFSTLKKANRFLVLNTIREYGPLTTEDIVYRTRLSRPTVINILQELTSDNYIYKSGLAESVIGRQPNLFSLNPVSFYAIGIDFDFPPVRLSISDLNGANVYSRYWELNTDDTIDEINESLIYNINASIEESGLDRNSFIGIGIGLPAIINLNKNLAVKIDRIKEWYNISIDRTISEATGLQVYIRNDAHLLGMVEKSFLSKDVNNLLYIVHRSGIGMAIFINNSLYEGNFGNSGYIGHTSVNFNGQSCECGKKGCLELYCSKRSIVNEYKKQKDSFVKTTFDEIVEKSQNGDDVAHSVLSNAGNVLGYGISNAIKFFDISNVILGDSVISENNPFFVSLRESIEFNVSNYMNQPVYLNLGKLEKKDYGLGGCHFVLDKFFKEPELLLHV